jgi:hypothetical protein
MADDPTASTELHSRFSLPQGWAFDNAAPLPSMAGPEGDLRIAFVELALGPTMPATALEAWHKLDPAFDAPVLQERPSPSAGYWDKIHQVVFATPESESRLQVAIIRTLGSRAYVNLCSNSGDLPREPGCSRLRELKPTAGSISQRCLGYVACSRARRNRRRESVRYFG